MSHTVPAVVRFYTLDIFGGFYMLLACGFGCYSIRSGIEMRWLVMYGMISLFSSLFDTVSLINTSVHSPAPFFASQLGFQYNLIHALLLLGPIALACSACLVYYIHTDSAESSAVHSSFRQQRAGNYGSGDDSNKNHFTPFQGQGNSLGERPV